MSWKEMCAMDQRIQMISDHLDGKYTITQLSEMYEVSRNTIYKWIKRYQEEGASGLAERTKAPQHHPNATSLETAREIVIVKGKLPHWGPKKIIAWLEENEPERVWPAVSTAGDILKSAGLVKSRRRNRRSPPYLVPFCECNRPNAVWSADFKGQFSTGDEKLCYPLTISDNYSRYLLCCQGLRHPTFAEVQPWFERIFRKYGLPDAIRTDNGLPFASTGLGGLSQLSIWFIKLGIKPERIKPGHPEENGRHERMHRSLKEAVAHPPKSSLRAQQKAFDGFIQEYDNQRPNEALGMKVPASFYQPSFRAYPVKLPEITYHGNYIVRQVRPNGEIKWKGDLIYVSQMLAGEPVGLRQKGEHYWELWFSTCLIGILDELRMKVISISKKKGRESVNHVPGLKC